MKEDNKQENNEEIVLKKGFLKKFIYSITKFEKYPEMSAEGVWSAIKYIMILMAIFSVIISLGVTYQTYSYVNEVVDYAETQLPEIEYKDGNLEVKSEQAIIDDTEIGKIIIDTSTEDEQIINEHINSINANENGMIFLKDKIIMKSILSTETTTTDYKTFLENYNIQKTEFNKQDIINYVRSAELLSVYVTYFATMFIYTFVVYLLSVLVDALVLGTLGYLTAIFTKIKMRFVAIYNMAAYGLTLSIVLNAIYYIVNMFTGFTIEYFQVMYISIAYIYLIAAIFIIKSDFIKQQQELIKIQEEQKNVKKEIEEQKEEKKQEEKKNKKEKKEKDNKKEEKDNNTGETPEGSNA